MGDRRKKTVDKIRKQEIGYKLEDRRQDRRKETH